MIEDDKLIRLRACANENRCSGADLKRVLFYLPWHLNTVVRLARFRIAAFMRRAAASWFPLSISSCRGPETTIRNIIAAAKTEDLPTYHLILQWIRRNFHPLRQEFDDVEEMLPSGTPLQRIVKSVLAGNVRPAEKDIREFFRDDPRRLVKIVMNGYRENVMNLNELLRATVDLCGSENASQASAATGVLMEIRRQRGLNPSIEEKDLELFPQIWRRAILFSAVRRSAFLTPEFRLWLESDPFRSQDMPQTIRFHNAREKALEAISSGHFGNLAIKVLLENRDEFLKVSERIAAALSGSKAVAKSIPPEDRYSQPEPYLHNPVALALLIHGTCGAVLKCPEVWMRCTWISCALSYLPDASIDSILQNSKPAIRKKLIQARGTSSSRMRGCGVVTKVACAANLNVN